LYAREMSASNMLTAANRTQILQTSISESIIMPLRVNRIKKIRKRRVYD